jgi:hypothetical protein
MSKSQGKGSSRTEWNFSPREAQVDKNSDPRSAPSGNTPAASRDVTGCDDAQNGIESVDLRPQCGRALQGTIEAGTYRTNATIGSAWLGYQQGGQADRTHLKKLVPSSPQIDGSHVVKE